MSPVEPGIVPRWEWRTFGDAEDAAARLAATVTEGVHESDEVYLVSRDGGDTVKVRDGLMDVKHLEEVDDQGLQRWRPVMKAPSPVSAADLGAVLGALGVEAPPLAREAYRIDELIRRAVDGDVVRSVAVHKRRARYTFAGCDAEVTDVRADGRAMRTVAIESADPARVMGALLELGLDPGSNTSYPRALARLIGLAGSRGAVIDVGTNSVKLHIGERLGAGWWTVADRAVITRLGEGLQATGALASAPMERTSDAVCDMVRQARRAGAPDVVAVGTAALRSAANSAALVDAVRERCGILVEVISGDEESRLGYLAATSAAGRRTGSVVVVETGGGSSQFTFGDGDRIGERFSLDVGAVRLTERFGLDGPVSPAVLDDARAAVAAGLGRLGGRPRPDALIGTGGAFTNLAAVRHGLAEYDPEVVEGTVLDRDEIDRQVERYRTRSADERRAMVGLQPARGEVILAGATIVRAVLDALGCESVTVTDRGLRHALLDERFGEGREAARAPDPAGGSPPAG
jgi:exopolyphosphatase / guanosine-5'-triphosphate,3'-diphosphate pyrophosphatase